MGQHQETTESNEKTIRLLIENYLGKLSDDYADMDIAEFAKNEDFLLCTFYDSFEITDELLEKCSNEKEKKEFLGIKSLAEEGFLYWVEDFPCGTGYRPTKKIFEYAAQMTPKIKRPKKRNTNDQEILDIIDRVSRKASKNGVWATIKSWF